MATVMSTKLPNGRDVHAPYDDVRQAMQALYNTGRAIGAIPNVKRGPNKAKTDDEYQKAKQRGDNAFLALDHAIEAMLNAVVENTWDAALSGVFPFKCGHCGERFDEMLKLVDHATERGGVGLARPECEQALEASLRLASSWAKPAVPNG